jgi:protein dithiol:quinone oxidoreductase
VILARSVRHAAHRRNSLILLAVALASWGAVALAVYLQHSLKLNPCPLCIAQRYLFIGIGVCAVLSLAAGWAGGLRPFMATLGGLIALGGIGVAARHLYVVANPMADCGRDRVAEFINSLILADLYPKVFMAFGGCGDAVPPFLGLSYPAWAFILFTVCTAALFTVLVITLRERR